MLLKLAHVDFDDKVTLHEEEEEVDFDVEMVGGGVGLEEDEQDGWWEVETGVVELAKELVEDRGVG